MAILSINGKLRFVPLRGVQGVCYPCYCTAKYTQKRTANTSKTKCRNAHRNAQTMYQTKCKTIRNTIPVSI